MVRHKAIKTTLEVGTHDEWNDDHICDFSDVIDLSCCFITPALTTLWDIAQTAGGVNPVLAFIDHHAFAELNTGGVTGQISSMRYEFNGAAGNITYLDDAPIMVMAVWLEAYHTAGLVAEFGLIDSATAAAFTANQDGAYFRVEDNTLYAVTGNGAAETATDLGAISGLPEYGHYKIELTGSNCLFYVDDMDTPAHTETLTLPDADLTMKYSIQSQNNVDSFMYVDASSLQRNRYKG